MRLKAGGHKQDPHTPSLNPHVASFPSHTTHPSTTTPTHTETAHTPTAPSPKMALRRLVASVPAALRPVAAAADARVAQVLSFSSTRGGFDDKEKGMEDLYIRVGREWVGGWVGGLDAV